MNITDLLPKPPAPKAPHVKIVRHVITEPAEQPVAPKQRDAFHKISQTVSTKLGSPMAFLLAALLIIIWATSGPLFGFSDTWQLVINTTTTIVTFLMVFAIQNTQNREARATQLKLSELIKSSRGARTEFIDIENLNDVELDELQNQFKELHEKFQIRTEAKKNT